MGGVHFETHVFGPGDRMPEPVENDSKTIFEGLRSYNAEQTGISPASLVRIFLRDQAGHIKGGLLGSIRSEWLSIEILWITEEMRNRDFGSEIIRLAEEVGRTHGCKNAHLDTFSFQAREFYEKMGYNIHAELHDVPPFLEGTTRYYLKKCLK